MVADMSKQSHPVIGDVIGSHLCRQGRCRSRHTLPTRRAGFSPERPGQRSLTLYNPVKIDQGLRWIPHEANALFEDLLIWFLVCLGDPMRHDAIGALQPQSTSSALPAPFPDALPGPEDIFIDHSALPELQSRPAEPRPIHPEDDRGTTEQNIDGLVHRITGGRVGSSGTGNPLWATRGGLGTSVSRQPSCVRDHVT
jgi:hypothetical protein